MKNQERTNLFFISSRQKMREHRNIEIAAMRRERKMRRLTITVFWSVYAVVAAWGGWMVFNLLLEYFDAV